ncbi:hypothetical protein E2562_001394 [Oryza meyeriana var. granulata]|uniref:Uncharacterized protein n=1 Tax=Oryza meyeriana var. granulata TaxID=110450 RepID=A0A6G1DDD0_9ORYZ|nr:hypothetical protein E2562_001394 [Oryza meyeriana var. granulata]
MGQGEAGGRYVVLRDARSVNGCARRRKQGERAVWDSRGVAAHGRWGDARVRALVFRPGHPSAARPPGAAWVTTASCIGCHAREARGRRLFALSFRGWG